MIEVNIPMFGKQGRGGHDQVESQIVKLADVTIEGCLFCRRCGVRSTVMWHAPSQCAYVHPKTCSWDPVEKAWHSGA